MHSFFPSAIKIWNNLPQDVIISNDVNQFKQKLTGLNFYVCMYAVICALHSFRGLHSITNNNN